MIMLYPLSDAKPVFSNSPLVSVLIIILVLPKVAGLDIWISVFGIGFSVFWSITLPLIDPYAVSALDLGLKIYQTPDPAITKTKNTVSKTLNLFVSEMNILNFEL